MAENKEDFSLFTFLPSLGHSGNRINHHQNFKALLHFLKEVTTQQNPVLSRLKALCSSFGLVSIKCLTENVKMPRLKLPPEISVLHFIHKSNLLGNITDR